MADTERQIQANRQRAELSTGPTTEQGKATSRANACRHGLSGAGVALPPDEAEEVRRRTEAWRAVHQPADEVEAFHVGQFALESVRVERCQAQERALLRRLAGRAHDPRGWDEDRRLAAEEAGALLTRDPARAVRRLRQSAQGCDWLILRWEGLARALGSGRPWGDAQRRLALDLLGLPASLRVGPTPADPGEGREACGPQAALAAGQVAELSRLRDEILVGRDEEDRQAAALGLDDGEGALSHALRLVRRYEAACQRRLQRALHLMFSSRPPAPAAPAVAERPEPPAQPAPQPAPRPAPVPRRPGPGDIAAATRPPVAAATAPAPASATEPSVPGAATGDDGRPRGNRRWRKAQLRRARRDAA